MCVSTLFLCAGALYTWGGGYFGQLGQGDEADKKMPRSVKGLRDKVKRRGVCEEACGCEG